MEGRVGKLRRRHKRYNPIKHALLLLAVPILVASSGYALFSQQLSIDASTAKPAYSRSQNLLLTYDKVVTVYNANRWEFNLTFTVANQGTSGIDSWHLTFNIPSNANAFKCFDDTVCTNTSGAVVVDNGSSTGIIPAGSSVDFTMRFRLTTDTYTLQNIDISGTFAPVYQTMSGLTVSYTVGTRNRHQGVYYWYYTFTVTNNTGQNLSAWRILADWDSSVNGVWANGTDNTINYFEDTNQLRLISKSALANNNSFQFVADIGSTDRNWTLGNHSIEGAL